MAPYRVVWAGWFTSGQANAGDNIHPKASKMKLGKYGYSFSKVYHDVDHTKFQILTPSFNFDTFG